jgi:hypothetical protein
MNCGLVALRNINELKNISLFTLMQLAKDNGIELMPRKVNLKDLPLVARPAILHTKDHFVYVENGKPLDDLEYSGYILTGKAIGRPVAYSEAKTVKGGAPVVAVIGAVVSAVTAVASVVATGLGSLVGAVPGLSGFGASFSTLGANLAASAAVTGAGTAAGATLGGIGSSLLSSAGALIGPAGGAVIGAGIGGAKGGIRGAVAGGALGFGAGSLAAPFGQAFGAAARGGASIGQSLSTAFKAQFPSLGKQTASTAAGIPDQTARGLASNVPSSAPAIPSQVSPNVGATNRLSGAGPFASPSSFNPQTGAGVIGTSGSNFNLTSVPFNEETRRGIASSQLFSTPGLEQSINRGIDAASAASAASTGGTSAQSGGILSKIGDFATNQANKLGQTASQTTQSGAGGGGIGNALASGALSLAGRAFGPQQPKTVDFNPTAEFATLRTFLGDQRLPQATEDELFNFVNTPLEELSSQLSIQNDKVFRRVNETFDKRDASIRRQAAQFGQSEQTSSDVQKLLQESNLDRATALSEAEQDIRNETVGRAIQAKQFALSNSLAKNQFDDNLAFELASLIGQKAALETAIKQNDFESFQNLMSQILQIGFGGGATSGFNVNVA